MEKLVSIKNSIPVADSRDIAKGFDVEHRSVYRLIITHQKHFEDSGLLRFEIARSKKGREQRFCYLNEEQALFLVTLMRNSDIVVAFKKHLVRDFKKMQRALNEVSLNKKNQEWLTNREDGKLQRKATTNIISLFLDYAISQGSKNASRYFGNISKMENKALFIVQEKFPNLREVMNNRQLSFIKSADIIVEEAIREGMEKEMFYKDIYTLSKKRVEAFSDLIPKTSIPMQIGDK
ncbi:MAG: Rha family transcriptional regulator [Deltaproteobacteria bacterium]|nr:Rha family transcriptional regulator [Deltaproteobacteria bacterium]